MRRVLPILQECPFRDCINSMSQIQWRPPERGKHGKAVAGFWSRRESRIPAFGLHQQSSKVFHSHNLPSSLKSWEKGWGRPKVVWQDIRINFDATVNWGDFFKLSDLSKRCHAAIWAAWTAAMKIEAKEIGKERRLKCIWRKPQWDEGRCKEGMLLKSKLHHSDIIGKA